MSELGRIAFYIYENAMALGYIKESSQWLADNMYDVLERKAMEFIASEYNNIHAQLYDCVVGFVLCECKGIEKEAMR